MKIHVDLGVLRGRFVGRVRMTDNGKWNSVKREYAADGFKMLMEKALADRLTSEPFKVEFSFWIEPQKITGARGREEGSMRTDYKVHPCCTMVGRESGMEVYQAILSHCELTDLQ